VRIGLICAAFRVVALSVVIGVTNVETGWAETGTVALRVSGCDYYLITTNKGYVLAEWHRGYDPSKGDFVAGAFGQYGMRTLFFGTDHKESRAYIEDYWLDGNDALEQLSTSCD
jgi:hypothetical protein